GSRATRPLRPRALRGPFGLVAPSASWVPGAPLAPASPGAPRVVSLHHGCNRGGETLHVGEQKGPDRPAGDSVRIVAVRSRTSAGAPTPPVDNSALGTAVHNRAGRVMQDSAGRPQSVHHEVNSRDG